MYKTQCFLKLEMWNKAVDNCSAAIEIDGRNAKALFRRAQAWMGLKDYDKAQADLKLCLEVRLLFVSCAGSKADCQ